MATATNMALVGVFKDSVQAQQAVQALRDAGFAESEIGVVARSRETIITPGDVDQAEGVEAGAITGAVGGAGVGGLWALAIAAGVLPAIGPVIAGGLLASILASAAGGAAVGGLVGAFVGMGTTEEDARYYESEVHAGNTIVTVHGNSRSTLAHDILVEHGAKLRD